MNVFLIFFEIIQMKMMQVMIDHPYDKIWQAKSNLSIEFCSVSPVDNVMLQLYLMSHTSI